MLHSVLTPDAHKVRSLEMTIWNDSWTEPERVWPGWWIVAHAATGRLKSTRRRTIRLNRLKAIPLVYVYWDLVNRSWSPSSHVSMARLKSSDTTSLCRLAPVFTKKGLLCYGLSVSRECYEG